MPLNTETASNYFRQAAEASDRGDRESAIYYGELGVEVLLRQAPVEIELKLKEFVPTVAGGSERLESF